MPPEPLFHARDLMKVYRMGEVEVPALRGVDLDLYPGEFVVILGPSGSGKSTLLNILGGLDAPTSGTVTFRDHVLTQAEEGELTRYRREHVGFVFQFYNLIPSLTAVENVELVTSLVEGAHGHVPADPAETLALVGLGGRLDAFPAQLSGGEQQRVAIARAVAKRPDVLLCDEPTARTIRSALGVDEQRVQVIGEVVRAPRTLGHDFAVEASIVLGRLPQALVVPTGALVRDGDRWAVYVVNDRRRVRLTSIRLLARGETQAAVEGIEMGRRVVVYPPEALREGTRVR